LNPIFPIIISLVILCGVGALYNNATASGLTVTPILTCNQADGGAGTCQNSDSNPNGCSLDPSQCSLSGTSISFLNINSPFTDLIDGNILGLFSNLNGANAATVHGPFDPTASGVFYTEECSGSFTKGVDEWENFAFKVCTQTDSGNGNVTESAAQTFLNWNPSLSGVSKTNSLYHMFFAGSNGTNYGTCNSISQLNYTGTIGFAYYGCDVVVGTSAGDLASPSAPHWSVLIAIPNQYLYTLTTTTYTHFALYIQPQQWETLFCAFINQTPSSYPSWLVFTQCQTFYTATAGVTTGGLSSFNFGFLTPLIGFLLGIVLFIIGLNLTLGAGGSILGSGTNFMVGTGSQGARLAQSLGVALIVFSPLYSEFSPWMTNLPNGLNVIVPLFITGFFFFGAYLMALQSGQEN
jgi:hypothetical protein